MENGMPGRGAPAHASGSAGAAARGPCHRRRPAPDAAGCPPGRTQPPRRPARLRALRDAARHDSTAPADAPAAALKVLAAKLHRPAECFETNREFVAWI